MGWLPFFLPRYSRYGKWGEAMNLLDLYRDDIDGRITSVSGGKEYRGPCPKCGGNDRFGVWPQQDNGRGSFFCGRGKDGGGNGCGIGGDAVQYLRDVRGYTYQEACDCLGIEARRGGESLQYRTPVPPKKYQDPAFVPQALNYPEDVVDAGLWHDHGMKFVEACHAALLARPTSIAYLMARGISMASITRYQLGFHAGEERDGKQYEPSFRPWPSWGLKDEKRENGKHRMLILPAGLVIPYIVDGRLHRITIRLIKPDPKQPKKKYHYVRGSIRDVWMSNPKACAFVIQEAELDCIAVAEAAGDLVGTIGLGSTGVKPEIRSAASLTRAIAILDALDYDGAGAKAGKWWRDQYPQCSRWPVPQGKDAGEAFAAGVSLRTWILAGLPSIFHDHPSHEPAKHKNAPNPAEVAPKVIDHGSQAGEDPAAVARVERILQEKKCPPTSDVKELKSLLEEASGFFRIYDHGNAVGPEIPPDWTYENREKRARIAELLFTSESVGILIENLADGLYGPRQIPV